jgi:O-antigen/teichoic acid export membrane protein
MNQIKEYSVFGKQIGYTIATSILAMIISFVQVPIITKNLGTSLYGTWSLISVAVAFIVPFSMLSFSMSIIRFLAAEKDPKKVREDFYSACVLVLVSGTVFSLLLFLLSDFLATSIFKEPSSAYYIRLGSVLVLLNSLFLVVQAFFRTGRKIGTFNLLNLGLHVIQVGLIVVFLMKGYQLTGVILAAIIGFLTLDILALILVIKQIGFQRPRFSNMKFYLKWGIPLTPNSAIWWIIQASDRYLIGFFLGTSAVGIYNAAYQLGIYTSFASAPVGTVLFPIVSRSYDEGKFQECSDYLKYSFKYLMMIAIPAAVGLSVMATPLLNVLTTPEFSSGNNIVSFVAFGALFLCLWQACSYIIQLVGKTQMFIRLLGVAALLNVILNVILIRHMGIFGAGLASLLAYGVLGILGITFTRKYLKFDLSITFLLKSILSAGVMGLCIWLMKPVSLSMIFVSIAIGLIVYFSMLFLTRGFSKSEINFFGSFVRNNLRGVTSLVGVRMIYSKTKK